MSWCVFGLCLVLLFFGEQESCGAARRWLDGWGLGLDQLRERRGRGLGGFGWVGSFLMVLAVGNCGVVAGSCVGICGVFVVAGIVFGALFVVCWGAVGGAGLC